jgi:DNA-directed RNA polymerase specialized sigma subunit
VTDDDQRFERNETAHERNQALARAAIAAVGEGRLDDAAALRSQLVAGNEALGRWWAYRYKAVLADHTVEEWTEIAVEAMRRGADTWDPDGGASFGNWSQQAIRGSLQRRVAKLYGRALAPVARAVITARLDLERELQRHVSDGDVAERTGLHVDRVRYVERRVGEIRRRAVPLDDDQYGDHHQRITAAAAPSGHHDDGFAEALAGLSVRHRRLASHIVGRGGLRSALAAESYADELGVPVSDVLEEIEALTDALAGRDNRSAGDGASPGAGVGDSGGGQR